jgi:hypothetical protein
MAEDEETATARCIASNISTELILKTIIEIISTMSDDSDKRMQRGPAVRDGGGHRPRYSAGLPPAPMNSVLIPPTDSRVVASGLELCDDARRKRRR